MTKARYESLPDPTQVEELRQHGYVVVDNFIPAELAEQVKAATIQQHSRGRMADAPWTAAGDAR